MESAGIEDVAEDKAVVGMRDDPPATGHGDDAVQRPTALIEAIALQSPSCGSTDAPELDVLGTVDDQRLTETGNSVVEGHSAFVEDVAPRLASCCSPDAPKAVEYEVLRTVDDRQVTVGEDVVERPSACVKVVAPQSPPCGSSDVLEVDAHKVLGTRGGYEWTGNADAGLDRTCPNIEVVAQQSPDGGSANAAKVDAHEALGISNTRQADDPVERPSADIEDVAYLAEYGYVAVSGRLWCAKRGNRRPKLAISVVGHHEVNNHTVYDVRCTLQIVGTEQIAWQLGRRLCELREVHAEVRPALGSTYDYHFYEAHFANRGGLPGTTEKLNLWFGALANVINHGKCRPKLVAFLLNWLQCPKRQLVEGVAQEPTFRVKIKRKGGGSWGMSVEIVDGKLLVVSVDDGPFSKWNAAHPFDTVQVGDRVMEVNGVGTSPPEMVKIMQNSDALDLVFMANQ